MKKKLRIAARAAAETGKVMAALRELVAFKSTALTAKRTAYAQLEAEIVGRSQ